MSQPFAVFDIDGTLIRWQLYHATADALAKGGAIDDETFAAIRSSRMAWKNRTHPEAFKDYERALVTAYERMLKQLSPAAFDQAVAKVIEQYKEQTYTYTRQLIKDLRKQHYLLLAISGSQMELIAKLADYYGFDDYLGTEYKRSKDHFTGEVIHYASDKQKALQSLVDKHQLAFAGSIAIGDSASDIPMLEMVEQAIAFNPDRTLFDTARKNGWPIVVERKNVVYELQKDKKGYVLE
ncbi:MAG TPA: HAD family phosphatase [Patescibacteria group bacterium]|nr:HAD family phosphatase [Patescibacteria group bacterium]